VPSWHTRTRDGGSAGQVVDQRHDTGVARASHDQHVEVVGAVPGARRERQGGRRAEHAVGAPGGFRAFHDEPRRELPVRPGLGAE
jgi:hypothetical protein